MTNDATKAIKFLERLKIPEGPNAGKPLKLAHFQKAFVRGALKQDTAVGVLSIGRGNAKTALSAGIALGALLGEWDGQPRREIVIGARTRDQARIGWGFAEAFARSLPDEIQAQFTFRRGSKLEIEYDGDGGGHLLRVIASDAKNALGGAPTLALFDERGHWPADQGDALEAAILSGLGKRGGRALIISTSAPDDSHSFSQWIDAPPPGTFVLEYRPPPGLPADDHESLMLANPGAKAGIGSSPAWLQAQAQRAIARGGSALSTFRLYNRNERVSGEARGLLLTVDEWLGAEVSDLPPREGEVVVGIDLGGSASMTAAAFYWPATGRLEAKGWFPSEPSLLARGQADGVNSRYCEMADRGELSTLGARTVPVAQWLAEVMQRVQGQQVGALVADRYKAAELGEAMQVAGVRCPVIWRGMGFRDGSEDIERFRRAVFDGVVGITPSLLLRSAFADAVTLSDPAGNLKMTKARSLGRIDAAAATVLAVAEGARRRARPMARARAPIWA
jgi:phage terminase large subunit-like protein